MPQGTINYTLLNGSTVEVDYAYTKAEPELYCYSTGDPGCPGTPAEVEILSAINEEGVDVSKTLNYMDQTGIEYAAYEKEEDGI